MGHGREYGSRITTFVDVMKGTVNVVRLKTDEEPKYPDGYNKIGDRGFLVWTTTLAQRMGQSA